MRDTWGIIFTILLGCFFLHGCAAPLAKNEYWKVQYPLRGKCFAWTWIQKKAYGKDRCKAIWKRDDMIRCRREIGHKGKHHAHYGHHCIAVFH